MAAEPATPIVAPAEPADATERRTRGPRTEPVDCGCGYSDCTACAGYGWACLRCGLAFFGHPPDGGLCPRCRAGAAA